MADPKPFSTVAQLRARRIIVTVPGDGETEPVRIACRRPDPLELFAGELLPLTVYAAVVEVLATSSSVGKFSEAAAKDPATYGDFIDRWACAAALQPLVVPTAQDATDEAIWVEELPPDVRVAIFMRTNDRLVSKRVIDAVAEFRRHQPLDHDPGSDGTPVRESAVEPLSGH